MKSLYHCDSRDGWARQRRAIGGARLTNPPLAPKWVSGGLGFKEPALLTYVTLPAYLLGRGRRGLCQRTEEVGPEATQREQRDWAKKAFIGK